MFYNIILFWCLIKFSKNFYPWIPDFISQSLFIIMITLCLLKLINGLLKISSYSVFILFFTPFYICLTLFLQLILFGNNFEQGVESKSTLLFVYQNTFVIFSWFAIGLRLGMEKIEVGVKSFIFFISFILIILLIESNNYFMIDYNILSLRAGKKIDHLSYGEAVILILIILYPSLSLRLRSIHTIIGCGILFSLGGRTTLLIFIISSLFINWRYSKKDFFYILHLAVFFVFGVLIISYILSNIDESSSLNRMVLLKSFDEDSSLLERIDQLLIFIKNFEYYAAIGNVNLVLKSTGSFGGYVHNFLSAIQFSGVFGLFLILFCLIFFGKIFIKIIIRREVFLADKKIQIFIFMYLYVLGSLIIGRHVGISTLWLLIGFGVGIFLEKKRLDEYNLKNQNQILTGDK